MMSSVWKPLPDKENPVLAIKQPSKVRANGPIKISNRGAIPKKQVFGDLKNTIQNLKADNGECGISKSSKSVCSVSSSDVKLCDENWPEPELLPTMHAQEDVYEEFLLPGLQFSKLELEDLSDVFGKTGRPLPLNMEPDSPLSLPQGTIHLDIRLEFPDDCMYEIPPVWVDDF